jgi:hypothetical protein
MFMNIPRYSEEVQFGSILFYNFKNNFADGKKEFN